MGAPPPNSGFPPPPPPPPGIPELDPGSLAGAIGILVSGTLMLWDRRRRYEDPTRRTGAAFP
jgi:hypothetical protein